MSAQLWLAVGVLGGAGAIARYALDGAVSRRIASAFPFGTLAVNLSGAFLLGMLAGASLQRDALVALGGGLLGSYTTFSTWMFHSQQLAVRGRVAGAVLNVACSLALGLLAVWLGRELGSVL